MIRFILPLLCLAGCTFVRPVTLPSGEPGEMISCNGAALSMADCYLKAGTICPAGYDVVDAGGSSTPTLVATPRLIVAGNSSLRFMMVRCH
jgi:hypothetical protein